MEFTKDQSNANEIEVVLEENASDLTQGWRGISPEGAGFPMS